MLTRALVDLALTIVVECGVVAVCRRRLAWPDAIVVCQVNLVTNPLAHLAVLGLGLGFWTVKAMVLVVEVGLLRLLLVPRWSQARLVANLANGTTACLSFALAAVR